MDEPVAPAVEVEPERVDDAEQAALFESAMTKQLNAARARRLDIGGLLGV